MKCPFCGGTVIRCEISGDVGTQKFSLCCDMPTDMIDQYEVFSALPAQMQEDMITQRKAEWAEGVRRAREHARQAAECREKWHARYAHLIKAN